MIQINRRLKALEEAGKVIRIGLLGAGQMGRGLANQLSMMKGMEASVIIDLNLELAVKAFLGAGIPEDNIKKADSLSHANTLLESGKYVYSDNPEIVSAANLVDVAIDATGVPDVGAAMAWDAIKNKKHVVMLNVETDVVIGPLLKKAADEAGVIYTGSAGDEPGAVMELYDFADALGFEIRAMGKGKNNTVVAGCTPDSVREEAMNRGVSPRMLCSFKDGTKTMVELAAMSNATGLLPDVLGCHAPTSSLKDLPKVLSLKEEGGILNKYGALEFINGIAPGVFVMVSSESDELRYQLKYHSMGDGPNYILYRPYHLCNIETPLSAARAYLDHTPTIVPLGGLVSDIITYAKKDLKSGEYLDYIGGFTVYGKIASYKEAVKMNALPVGLINSKTKVLKDIKAGELLTLDSVTLDDNSDVVRMRRKQDSLSF
ncbi:MAG: NAD(P)-dependent oxidoreductase [Spirochaetales bacterium]|nr:NAD(P)-dependent oxidoreductase [Spirochaetales bacterium]